MANPIMKIPGVKRAAEARDRARAGFYKKAGDTAMKIPGAKKAVDMTRQATSAVMNTPAARKAAELAKSRAGQFAGKIGGGALKKGIPVLTALQVAALSDPQRRKEAYNEFENSSKKGPLGRAIDGALDPVTTFFGTGAAIKGIFDAKKAAAKSDAAYEVNKKKYLERMAKKAQNKRSQPS